MDLSTGIFRIKVIWAILCGLIGVGAILMLSQGGLPSDMFGRMIIGLVIAVAAVGGTPLLDEPLKNKTAILCGGLLAGLSLANGKWPDGAIAAALISAFIWVSWTAVAWVINGFANKRRQ